MYATRDARPSVREAARMPTPLFVLPNGGGLGYGLFVLDEAERDVSAREHVERHSATR